MYFESQKDPIFLLISRLLTFARRKQFYAYDSDNFTKIENILKYNANMLDPFRMKRNKSIPKCKFEICKDIAISFIQMPMLIQ